MQPRKLGGLISVSVDLLPRDGMMAGPDEARHKDHLCRNQPQEVSPCEGDGLRAWPQYLPRKSEGAKLGLLPDMKSKRGKGTYFEVNLANSMMASSPNHRPETEESTGATLQDIAKPRYRRGRIIPQSALLRGKGM